MTPTELPRCGGSGQITITRDDRRGPEGNNLPDSTAGVTIKPCPGCEDCKDRDPERCCPTCGSDDPAVCIDGGGPHPHRRHDPKSMMGFLCCRNSFHQPLPEQGEGSERLEAVQAQNAELDAVADELIQKKAPGYKHLAVIRERDELRGHAQAEHEKRLEAERELTRQTHRNIATHDARIEQKVRAETAEQQNASLRRELEERDQEMLRSGQSGVEWPRYTQTLERAETAEQERDEARQHYRATNDAYIAQGREFRAAEQRVAALTSALERLLALTEEIAHYTPGYVAEDENGDPKFAPIREARSALADTKEESR